MSFPQIHWTQKHNPHSPPPQGFENEKVFCPCFHSEKADFSVPVNRGSNFFPVYVNSDSLRLRPPLLMTPNSTLDPWDPPSSWASAYIYLPAISSSTCPSQTPPLSHPVLPPSPPPTPPALPTNCHSREPSHSGEKSDALIRNFLLGTEACFHLPPCAQPECRPMYISSDRGTCSFFLVLKPGQLCPPPFPLPLLVVQVLISFPRTLPARGGDRSQSVGDKTTWVQILPAPHFSSVTWVLSIDPLCLSLLILKMMPHGHLERAGAGRLFLERARSWIFQVS